MYFKDNLGKLSKTIGDKASLAAKKSAELFEATKIDIAIYSEKDSILEMEEKIGHLIYIGYKEEEDMSDKVLKLCKKIDEKYETIAKMSKKLVQIKKVKVCGRCGDELPLNAKFCPNCGKSL